MKNTLKSFLLLGMITITISSCKKEDAMATSATITFEEPTANSEIIQGSAVHSEGTIVGNGIIHGYEVKYINSATNEVLHQSEYDVEVKETNFHEHWTNNLSDTTVVKVQVEALGENHAVIATKELTVTCLP